MQNMRYICLLLLVGIFTERTFCRPEPLQNVEESQGDEAEYEGEGAEADEALEEDEQPRLNADDSAAGNQDENADSGQSPSEVESISNEKQPIESHSTPANDDLSQYHHNKNEEDGFDKGKTNDEYESPSEQHGSSRYAKNFADRPDNRPFLNHDDTYKSLHSQQIPIDKRTLQSQAASNEEGDLLFEHNILQGRQDRTNNNAYVRSAAASSQLHNSKQSNYPVHESVPDENRYSKPNLERERRDAQDMQETIQSLSASAHETANAAAAGAAAAANAAAAVSAASDSANIADDEETAAIKRHVKKLSAPELKELLNSLSEDKRQLLMKIMENDDVFNVEINKREITKKAGVAPDDNNLVENGQSDASKLQESCAVSEANSNSSGTDSTEVSSKQQQSSMTVLPATKNYSEASNDSSFASLFTVKNEQMPDTVDINNLDNSKSNSPTMELKTNNKRETNPEVSNIESSFDDEDEKFVDSDGLLKEYSDIGRPEKDLSEFDDDQSETELFNKNGIDLKREASELSDDAADSITSLEDSFPNSNAYDDNDSDITPLVRVKRKNLDSSVNKRSANLMSDSKVAYCPYRAENEDEDNDEGSEFDDDGFYDRTSNLAKSVVKDPISDDGSPNNVKDDSVQLKSDDVDSQLNFVNPKNKQRDTASVGSDTDSVLSGVEGIDENLMINSAFRNRRTLADSKDSCAAEEASDEPVEEHARPARSTVLDEEVAVTQNNLNYHEKDSFSPLPNFEGDLGRYKRIRRVKPLVSAETHDL